MTARECTKKRDARAKLLFCQSKPIDFLPFSMPSPSSLLEFPITTRRRTTLVSKAILTIYCKFFMFVIIRHGDIRPLFRQLKYQVFKITLKLQFLIQLVSSVQAGGNIVRSVDLWAQFRDKRRG